MPIIIKFTLASPERERMGRPKGEGEECMTNFFWLESDKQTNKAEIKVNERRRLF